MFDNSENLFLISKKMLGFHFQEVTENNKVSETIVPTIQKDTPAAGGADSIESESVIDQAVQDDIKDQRPEDDFILAFVPLGESSTGYKLFSGFDIF